MNKLDTTRLRANYDLKQIVHFPTRGRNTLDQILTNLGEYYNRPVERPAFGLCDHCSIEVQPKLRSKNYENKCTTRSRDLRPSIRMAIRSYLEKLDIPVLISSVKSCAEKTEMLRTIVQTGRDLVAPVKTKTTYTTEPPWINRKIKSLIKRRQRSLALGNRDEYRRLRNCVNRERKACRAKYYDHQVEHLKKCSPARWWKEVKKLSGISKASIGKDSIIKSLKHLEGEDATDNALADRVNESFLKPMESFKPPAQRVDVSSSIAPSDPTLSISAASVFKKLSAINPSKAQGPDGIPGWLL